MDKDLSNKEIENKLRDFQDWINEQEDIPKKFGKYKRRVLTKTIN